MHNTKNILRPDRKGLRMEEASYVYCKRHHPTYLFDEFIDLIFMQEDFPRETEFDNICKDIRNRNYGKSGIENGITDNEWKNLIRNFGNDNKSNT